MIILYVSARSLREDDMPRTTTSSEATDAYPAGTLQVGATALDHHVWGLHHDRFKKTLTLTPTLTALSHREPP